MTDEQFKIFIQILGEGFDRVAEAIETSAVEIVNVLERRIK